MEEEEDQIRRYPVGRTMLRMKAERSARTTAAAGTRAAVIVTMIGQIETGLIVIVTIRRPGGTTINRRVNNLGESPGLRIVGTRRMTLNPVQASTR